MTQVSLAYSIMAVVYDDKISPGAKWHILAEPGNVSVSFFLDGFG